MKKLFVAAISVALSINLAFTTFAAVKLDAPQVRWQEGSEGVIEWTVVEDSGGEYKFEITRNGEDWQYWGQSEGITRTPESGWYDDDTVLDRLEDSGTYRFRVKAEGDRIETEDSDWSQWSSDWKFQKASAAFSNPTNLHWEGTKAAWDGIQIPAEYQEYFLGYLLSVCGDGDVISEYLYLDDEDSPIDLVDDMDRESVKEYTFTLRAISSMPSKVFHSETVSCNAPFDAEGNREGIAGKLEEITGNTDATEKELNAAIDDLSKKRNELQAAMQADEGIVDQVRKLEELYQEKRGSLQLEYNRSEELDDVFDTSSVSIVGALLNADSSTQKVTFNIGKPQREVVIDNTAYRNTVQVDFHLDGVVSDLKVPVMVTLDIPKNINPNFFHILHYYDDGKNYEVISAPELKIEGDKASFVVTRFSTFVLAEEGIDPDAVKTPEDEKAFKELAKKLPSTDKIDLEDAGVKKIVSVLAEALSSGKIKAKGLMDDDLKEMISSNKFKPADLSSLKDPIAKLAGAFDKIKEIQIKYDPDPIFDFSAAYLSAAANIGNRDDVSAVRLECKIPGKAENNALKMNVSMYVETDSNAQTNAETGSNAQAKGTKIGEIHTPVLLFFDMSDLEGLGYTYHSTDTVTVDGDKMVLGYDEDSDCLIIYTWKLGDFTLNFKKTSSASSGSSWVKPSNYGGSLGSNDYGPASKANAWDTENGKYVYYMEDGSKARDCWLQIHWNGTFLWYHFNTDGIMDVGWLNDKGLWYYLNMSKDGVYGGMLTGWHQIDGVWYYFKEISDGTKGSLYVNTTTPDGYKVDANGAWIQ